MASSPNTNITYKTTAILALMVVVTCISIFVVFQFIRSEEAREKIIWQNRLSVVVNGRSDVIEKWVDQQKKNISSLAENASLRLYFNNISNDLGLDEAERGALREYLQPLLNDRAIQNGFVANQVDEDLKIKANVERPKYAGIALTNLEGQMIVATANMPSVLPAITSFLSSGANKDTVLVGPYDGESGLPTVAFISPVYSLNDAVNEPALGFLIGVKPLDQSFFDLLIQPGEITETAENYLIRKEDDLIHYLSSYNNSAAAFIRPVNADTELLADSFAMANPGVMTEKIDRQGQNVLVSGVNITGTDWFLIRTVAVNEAFGPIQSRKRNIIIVAALIIAGLCISVVLIWRHGVSVRLSEAVKQQTILVEKYENLSRFMRMVTDNQKAMITSVDEKSRYTFVNLKAARQANSNSKNMLGKTPSAIFGNAIARIDEIHCQKVLAENIAITHIQNDKKDDRLLTFKTDYIPLIADDNDKGRGVLVVKEDITELEENRMRREMGLKSLISTLTMIISSRDPYSAAHSEKVVLVTKTLTKELDVDEITSSTAELAAAMMNLGKILVPRELLVKPSNLNSDELEVIRSSMLKSADLIKDIEFEGPVCETLKQIQAHWDGSGNPKGLSGEEILLSARIVSVANAFVGMVSARAHRSGIEMNEAVKLLLKDTDKIYDRRPVISLMNYIENKGGLKEWAYFSKIPKDIN